jgi:hypothetical protein
MGGAGGSGGVASPGTGGVVDPVTGGAAGEATGGVGGGPCAGCYSTSLGLAPDTPLADLPDESLIYACVQFDGYLRLNVPDADVARGFCVVDAVYVQMALTVEDCRAAVDTCVASVPPIPPLPCAGKGDSFECTATVGQFEKCATDFAAAKRQEFALLVCESIQDPDIEQKLTAARAIPESCATFEAACPGFFPEPPPPEM